MSHPYKDRPDYQFWKRAGGLDDVATLDPVVRTSFTFSAVDKVVTAGSCFAQHVARSLKEAGFNFYVTENGHPMFPDNFNAAHNFGLFSARYGNVYTARQLVQLLNRAWGKFHPVDDFWKHRDGYYVDPFRPLIQPGGYVSPEELRNDRRQHFFAVRQAIKRADVFVYTLGLTEAWMDKRDGSVYPLSPGIAGGEFDPDIHTFVNFSVNEVVADMNAAIRLIRHRNPNVRIVLTVSPVPLNATAEDRHVLVSTIYSKSVLRVAAEMVCGAHEKMDYFPSYEIITSPHAGGSYYAADKREVTKAGVDHVMGVFLRHYGNASAILETKSPDAAKRVQEDFKQDMEKLVRVFCDEEAISNV